MLMPTAFLIQTCCGSLYAWSGYNLPIEAKLYGLNGGIDRGIAVNVFYVAVCVFSVSAALLGPWLERQGPMKGGLLGSSLFFFGNLLTALGVYLNSLPCIIIGYGVFSGAGLGIAYIAPVSPLQKWFPEARGVAAGFAVCGYGAGSIFSPYAQKDLIGRTYPTTGKTFVGIELTFVIIGSCYFVIMTLCACVLRMPPPGYEVRGVSIHTVKGAERIIQPTTELLTISGDSEEAVRPTPLDHSAHFVMTLKESLLSLQYWMIYFMFIGAQLTGLLILSKIQSIVQNQLDRSPDEAAKINSILGAINLLGRLLLPLFSHLIKTRRVLYTVSLAVQVVCVGVLPTVLHAKSYGGTMSCIFIICFFYGGGFGMIPAFLADQFGAKNVGATHGVILTAWAIAGVGGGFIFTAVYNSQHAMYPDHSTAYMWYDLNFRWILGPVLFSFILSFFIPINLRDRKLPRVPEEKLRFRLVHGRLVRFVGWKGHVLTIAEEEREWQAYLDSLSNQPLDPPSHTLSSIRRNPASSG